MRGGNIARRGTPLVMLGVLITSWIAVRAATWDSPLGSQGMAKTPSTQPDFAPGSAQLQQGGARSQMAAPQSQAYAHFGPYVQYPAYPPSAGYAYPSYPPPARYAAAPQVVYLPYPAAPANVVRYPRYPLAPDLRPNSGRFPGETFALGWPAAGAGSGGDAAREAPGKRYHTRQQARPPFGAQPYPARTPSTDRWFLDAYGFYRQGSSALSVTQGRQPIYGASQLAANLQWRARPSSSHDPRIYARAYHALVPGGEIEVAAGASALPFGKLPVRLYGELRATRGPAVSVEGTAARTDFRPAAYAATEIPPLKLPLGLSMETYGAGGYVGGNASTYFLDGQAIIARNVAQVGKSGIGSANVSIGGGVWGGAQEGVHRVDIGPTLRFDFDLGKVPARVSVDYREQVAGDAEPDSGVAATVSTRF